MITHGEDVMHVTTGSNAKTSNAVGEGTTNIDAHIHRPTSSTGESDVDGHLSSTSTGLESFNEHAYPRCKPIRRTQISQQLKKSTRRQ